MKLESSIQEDILDYLNSLPECVAENQSGDASQKGRPDINGCWKGRSFRIEVKRGTSYRATKLQKINLRKWKKAGALCFVADTLEDVKKRIY